MDTPRFKEEVANSVEAGSPLIGTIIGDKYRLLSHLGRGCVSDVYKACDVASVNTVALKIIDVQRALPQESLRLFEHNARLNVQHPNLVSMHACGLTGEGQPWVAMEFLPGETLAGMQKREGCLAPDFAFAVFDQLLNAIGYLHSKGEIHMNLKPTNVILPETEGGQVFAKIADFGLGKIVLEQELERADEKAPAAGSPLYMSPEQLRGEHVDHRTDIYALGCMLYECLIGRPPHEGMTLLETMDRHFHAAIQFPSEPETSEALQAVLGKMLAKDPSERYHSITDIQADLANARAGKSAKQPALDEMSVQQRPRVKSYRPPQGMPARPAKKGNEPWMLLLTCVTILLFVLIIQQCFQVVADFHVRNSRPAGISLFR